MVNAFQLDKNGKLYVGGSFTTYKGTTANRIIRLNSDGTRDTAFSGSLGQTVQALQLDSNDKLYVGGFFVAPSYLIRLNPDGTQDTAFTASDINSPPYAFQIDTNGKLYVGGAFTTYEGITANRIIRLNADGTKDTAFDNSTGFDNNVFALQLDSNGKLYVGGQFTTYKGTAANRIIRLEPNGDKDTGFDNTTGFNNAVNTFQLNSNGKLYVGGQFTTYKGTTANNIIRLEPNGDKDTGFDNTTGFNNIVRAFQLDSNGKLYVGGQFTSYKSIVNNRLILLEPTGAIVQTILLKFIQGLSYNAVTDTITAGIFSGSLVDTVGLTVTGTTAIQQILEKVTVAATAATGTVAFDALTHAVLFYTANATGNWTLNVRGNSGATLNNTLAVGQSITIAFAVTNGTTAYYQTGFQIDGWTVTPKWQGGTAPTAGNANSIDVYAVTIIKTTNATFTVLESLTRFA